MNISDAFTTRAIEGFLLNQEESEELRGVVQEYLVEAQIDRIPAVENLAEVFFQAGRAYQATMGYLVPMSVDLLGEFLEFMRIRGES